MNDKVSIIIPVYNAELYLKQCIESLINQTYKQIEIILINDGSTDKSGEICTEYSKKDHRIKVIHKNNGGVSTARNAGLKDSTGNYIMFVDSDDWLDFNAVNILIGIQNKNTYEVIMFGAYRENSILVNTVEMKAEKQYFNGKDEVRNALPALIKEEQINALWNKMYKSSLIKDNNIVFEETLSIAEDALFNYQVMLKAKSVHVLDQCFYHYMIRDVESLTKRYNPKKYEMLTFVNNYIQQELGESPNYNRALQASQHIRIKNIYSCLLDLFSKYYPLSAKEKLRYIDEIIKKEDNEYGYYSYENLYKILIIIFSTKNKHLIYISTYIISKMRNGLVEK